MNCNDRKIEDTCGKKHSAYCVFFEGELPEWSELKDKECVNINSAVNEIYTKVNDIIEDSKLPNLRNSCIEYEENDDNEVTVKEAIEKLDDKLCNSDSSSNSSSQTGKINLNSISISDTNIDVKCLEDICGDSITTLEELLISLINKVCN